MPVYFQDLDDYLDVQLFKRALQEARRAKKGRFFYVPTSAAAGGPALLMTTGRMSPDLKRVLKKGGSRVKGKFKNLSNKRLVLYPSREVNRTAFATDVRALFLKANISIQLSEIKIYTPGDVKRRLLRRKARERNKQQTDKG